MPGTQKPTDGGLMSCSDTPPAKGLLPGSKGQTSINRYLPVKSQTAFEPLWRVDVLEVPEEHTTMSDAETTDTNWDDASYIISSSYRTAVAQALLKGPATPSTISEETDKEVTHISRALRELRDRDEVELLVSDDKKKGRIYALTEEGRPKAQAAVEVMDR